MNEKKFQANAKQASYSPIAGQEEEGKTNTPKSDALKKFTNDFKQLGGF